MRAQDEKIKGFNILELIVVVLIIGVLSAVGYPRFNDWRKDRETRDAVIQIRSLIQGIYSQTQRGQYAFVQVHISEEADGADRNIVVTSKGMKAETLASLLNNRNSVWWTANRTPDYANICNITDDAYWDDDPEQGADNIEVRQITLQGVATAWTGSVGAVCFGKNDLWFSGNGELASSSPLSNEVTVDNYLFICDRSNTPIQCNMDPVTGAPRTEHGQLYAIEWSRFGNISVEKWYPPDVNNGEWIYQQ